MRNFVQPGENLTLTAPAAVVSGQPVKIGRIVGIATGDAPASGEVVLVTVGVFDLPKVAAEALAAGDPIYLRASDNLVTGVASGNTLIGVATAPSANPSATARVRLNGSF